MKCTCARADLNDALTAVSKAVAIKPSTPVLAGIYLRAAGNEIELQATNFSVSITAQIPANVESEGAVVVSGKIITAVVSKLDSEIVTLANDDNPAALTLKSDAAAFELLSMDAEDFPQVHREDAAQSFRIRRRALVSLISRTVFACSRDDSRPVFTGCLFDISTAGVTCVATNASRIAVARERIIDEADGLRFILHAATLRNLLSMLSFSTDELVTVDFSGNTVAFSFGTIYMSARVIDGAFPPYDKVIPLTASTTATLDVAELRRALERLAIIAADTDYNSAAFEFSPDGLAVTADSINVGKSIEHIDAAVEGADIAPVFNISFLTDALKVFEGKRISFYMNQPSAPVKISAPDDASFDYILTPLRTQP